MSFWQAKTKLRNSDNLFSRYIRKRDGECKYKFRCFGHQEFKDLTCSHFIKRRHESVRFDPDNCDAACRPCHAWIEDTAEGIKALKEWKLKQLGQQKYNALLVRGNGYGQRSDDKLMSIYIRQLLKTL